MIAGQAISAARIIIATGSETIVPPIEGLKEAGFITDVQAVALPALPSRLAVIGGGTIGLEFAQIFHRFGVDVTMLEHGPTILDKEDRELAEKLCLAPIVLAMQANIPVSTLASTLLPYPTLSEAVRQAAGMLSE